MKLRLTIDVTYAVADGVLPDVAERDLSDQLRSAADHLAGEGLLSGETDHDVECWYARVERLEGDEPWRCRVCGDPVDPADFREHLAQHNPNAKGMDIEDVKGQFEAGGAS